MSAEIAVAQPVEETKKPEPVLTPAPVPTNSPWNVVANDIPVTTIDITSFTSGKNASSIPTVKTSANTKWTPIKASIVVAGSKKNYNGNANNNSNIRRNGKNGKNNNANANNRKNKKQIKQNNNQADNKKSDSNENDTKLNENQEQINKKQESMVNNGFPKRRQFNNQKQNRTGFRPQYKQMHQSQFSVQPVIISINNVARQLEYYFSEENLSKDTFLKEKLSKDGYAPLSLISKFYRIVNLSFNGDTSIIMAALREITFNENATVEVAYGNEKSTATTVSKSQVTEDESSVENQETKTPSVLDNYFIRSKNWESTVPETATTVVSIEKTLSGSDLNQFMIQFNQEPMKFENETDSPVENVETTEK